MKLIVRNTNNCESQGGKVNTLGDTEIKTNICTGS